MENIVLTVHLILALCLIGVVLLQRNEGGGGLMGGGGAITGRAAPTPLGRLTWAFAIAFIATSITLTILAARDSADSSVLDRLGDAPATEAEEPALPAGDDLLPPTLDEGPLVPPAAD